MTSELAWVNVARSYLGVAEIPGKAHSPIILRWLREARAWWSDDETPWCGTFVHAVIRETAVLRPDLDLAEPPKSWMRALAWSAYGYPAPMSYGAIVTFKRAGGGHVGICVGVDERGFPMILGGNQKNAVRIDPFDPARIDAVRYPLLGPMRLGLPLLASNGAPLSTNEA